ncbi:MAG: SdpI family protein [Sphingomonadaceae bacterium]|nr:SdpI family protein [Sphingomonadaceae bacterium]
MALELIAPNSFYGVRTSGTLESLDVWYRANFFAGMAAVVCGGAAILINLAIIRSTTIREDQKWWLTLGTFLLAAGAAVGAGLLAG